MSIKTLLDFMGRDNIAEDIDKDDLDSLGERVHRQFEEDHNSMAGWIEGVEKGLDLMKAEYNGKSTPWPNASNYKDSLLTKASIAFGDRASLELLRSPKLVKSAVIGKDKTGEKKKLADRVKTAMNYQVNYQIKEWRAGQKRLLYTMPQVGCMFKKTVFNTLEGKPESHIIHYPNFAVNQATTSMEKCRSFTQIHDFSKNEVLERQFSGLWLDSKDILESIYPKDSDGDKGSNEEAEVVDASDNPDRFLEQQCFADLDGDGYEEPYIVTIHESSKTVVRVVARYDETSLMVKTPSGRIKSLLKAVTDQQNQIIAGAGLSPDDPDFQQNVELLKQSGVLPEISDLNDFNLVRIEPFQQVTKYGFLASSDGTFLDVGYSHLLGAIVQAINTFTNQIADSGTLRNAGGGFKAKGFRKKAGPTKMRIGEWLQTNLSARDLQGALLPNPSPEPSVVLFSMLEKLDLKGNELASVVNASGQIQANTAPTTALAIINEALISTSALLGRVIDAESNEFQILFKLNQRTFDPELYKIVLDDPQANAESDFNNESLDIMPTASAEMSSKMQRIQTSVVEIEQIPNVIQAGGNPTAIVKNYFEAIGSQNIEEIFPEEPTEAQAEEMARFTAAQEQQNEIQLAQLKFQQLQTQILMREQARLDADTQRKIEETIAKIKQIEADTILKLEQAETEQVENQINTYTAEMKAITDSLTSIGEANAREADRINERTAQQQANNQGIT